MLQEKIAALEAAVSLQEDLLKNLKTDIAELEANRNLYKSLYEERAATIRNGIAYIPNCGCFYSASEISRMIVSAVCGNSDFGFNEEQVKIIRVLKELGLSE